jgi:hypothetical protein
LSDKNFSNRNLEQYAGNLQKKYGDFHLNTAEMDSVANATGTDIRNLEKILTTFDADSNRVSANINPNGYGAVQTTGRKEKDAAGFAGLRFGPRMMLHRRYQKGDIPYKYIEGGQRVASQQKGGTLNKDWLQIIQDILDNK